MDKLEDTVEPGGTPNLNEALARARSNFAAIKKDQTANIGTYSYRYADLAGVFRAVDSALASEGLAISQPFEVRDGTPYLRTFLLHSSGEERSSVIEIPWTPGGKATELGSLLTYLRRYALSAMLGVASEVDDDLASPDHAAPKTKSPPTGPPQRPPYPPNPVGGDSHRPRHEPLLAEKIRKGAPRKKKLPSGDSAPVMKSQIQDLVKACEETGIRLGVDKSSMVAFMKDHLEKSGVGNSANLTFGQFRETMGMVAGLTIEQFEQSAAELPEDKGIF